jgi:hypothetical protein
MGRPPSKLMIGNILHDKEFSNRLPARIRARINFIREIANAGVHGGDVTSKDAFRALSDLVDVVEWYVETFPPAAANREQIDEDAVEILPQLKQRLGPKLRPEVVAARFIQGIERCWLELTEDDLMAGYLKNRLVKREDLSFIWADNEPELYFSPTNEIKPEDRP